MKVTLHNKMCLALPVEKELMVLDAGTNTIPDSIWEKALALKNGLARLVSDGVITVAVDEVAVLPTNTHIEESVEPSKQLKFKKKVK